MSVPLLIKEAQSEETHRGKFFCTKETVTFEVNHLICGTSAEFYNIISVDFVITSLKLMLNQSQNCSKLMYISLKITYDDFINVCMH